MLAIAGGFAFAIAAAASGTLTQLGSDPYTNPTSQHKTEVEPDTFSVGSTIVAAFQVGRFTDGGASDVIRDLDGRRRHLGHRLPSRNHEDRVVEQPLRP